MTEQEELEMLRLRLDRARESMKETLRWLDGGLVPWRTYHEYQDIISAHEDAVEDIRGILLKMLATLRRSTDLNRDKVYLDDYVTTMDDLLDKIHKRSDYYD